MFEVKLCFFLKDQLSSDQSSEFVPIVMLLPFSPPECSSWSWSWCELLWSPWWSWSCLWSRKRSGDQINLLSSHQTTNRNKSQLSLCWILPIDGLPVKTGKSGLSECTWSVQVSQSDSADWHLMRWQIKLSRILEFEAESDDEFSAFSLLKQQKRNLLLKRCGNSDWTCFCLCEILLFF